MLNPSTNGPLGLWTNDSLEVRQGTTWVVWGPSGASGKKRGETQRVMHSCIEERGKVEITFTRTPKGMPFGGFYVPRSLHKHTFGGPGKDVVCVFLSLSQSQKQSFQKSKRGPKKSIWDEVVKWLVFATVAVMYLKRIQELWFHGALPAIGWPFCVCLIANTAGIWEGGSPSSGENIQVISSNCHWMMSLCDVKWQPADICHGILFDAVRSAEPFAHEFFC